jgi:cardiolipin synthase (CMP-forming)
MMDSEAPADGARRILTVPNVMSLARLASVPVFVWLFVSGHEEAGLAVYAVGAWSDFFDGYIARRTDSVTELGKLLDPLADRVLIVALAVALVAAEALPLWLAIVVIARDVLVLSLWPLLERRGVPRIAVNLVGKSATASLLLGLGWLAWGETTWPLHEIGDELGMAFTYIGAVLYWVAAVMYGRVAVSALTSTNETGVVE